MFDTWYTSKPWRTKLYLTKKTRISYTVIVSYGYSQGDKEALFPDLFSIFYWLELDVSLSKLFSRDSFLS